MKDLAVFASGHGTNFEALANAADQPDSGYRIAALVCDQSQAPVIQKAAARTILTVIASICLDFGRLHAYHRANPFKGIP